MSKGFVLGEVTPIFVVNRSIPSVIRELGDGILFIPLECTIEEGKELMESLSASNNKKDGKQS